MNTDAAAVIPPRYHRVETSVRPARVACLIFELDEWISPALRMIELFSRMWGGSGNVLFAYSEENPIPEALWQALERFDPDRLGHYVPTRRGQQMAAPEAFETWLDNEANRWASGSDVTSYDGARKQLLDSNFLESPMTSWRPPRELVDEALTRLGPQDADDPFDQAWHADGVPGQELLDMTNIREIEGAKLFCLHAHEIDPRIDLMLQSRIGGVSPSYEKTLSDDLFVDIRSFGARADNLEDVLDIAWAKDPVDQLRRTQAFRQAVGEGGEAGPGWTADDLANSPFRLTERGLASYIVGRPWRRDLPYIVVSGDRAQDYAFAMLLSRMYQNAIWVPFDFATATGEIPERVRVHLARHLDGVSGYGHGHAREVLLTSLSVDLEDLGKAWEPAWELGLSGSLGSRIETKASSEINLRKPIRLYDPDQLLRQRWEPFVNGELAGALDTPPPSAITERNSMNFTWHVDVSIDDSRYPPRAALNHLMAKTGSTEHAAIRASSDGASYFSREPFFIPAGATVSQSTWRPRLRIPPAVDLFEALLDRTGMRSVVSQAGRYSSGAIELWGGLKPLTGDLRDPARLALLEGFRKKSASGVDPGVYISPLKRRFLSIWDVRRATGLSTLAARELLDDYVKRSIVSRGLCLKCARCNYASWYPDADVTPRFVCTRCRHEQPLEQAAWLKPVGEPLPFYQLDEMALQAIENDARAPLLALDQYASEMRGFLFAPEMDVFQGNNRIAEVDIWVIGEAAIVLGEAKSTNNLGGSETEEKRSIDRLMKVAVAVTAHEVCFATTEQAWSPRTRRLVETATQGTPIRPRFLTQLGDSS